MPTELERETARIRDAMRILAPGRNAELFVEFLPRGYEMTRLSSVDSRFRGMVQIAKLKIGTLITLYDDLADQPRFRNPELLGRLYRLPFESIAACAPVEAFAQALWREVMSAVAVLPWHRKLRPALEFDIRQFYSANRYSEMITDEPRLASVLENQAYLSHNMGMVLTGTIDLMASPGIRLEELGPIRSFLLRSQRAARLMNVVTTFERELRERDVTNEVLIEARAASEAPQIVLDARRSELERLLDELEAEGKLIRSFDAGAYVDALRSLYALHLELEAVI